MTTPDTKGIRVMADALEATIGRILLPGDMSREAEAMRALCDALDKLRADIETCTANRDEWADRAMTELGNVLDLRAENERLRSALTKINVGDGWAAQIARAALGRDGNMYSAVNTAC